MPAPPVIVTTDLDGPPTPSDGVGTPATPSNHRRTTSQASDPTHLSPTAQSNPASFGQSPAPSVNSALTPPSPTLTSNSSVHFTDENGNPADGLEPIGEHTRLDASHKRDGSWSNEKPAMSMISPATTKQGGEEVDEKDGRKKNKKNKAPPPVSHLDPEKDTTDPTPFREKPSRLAMLVDPKSLEDLEKIGGVEGLLDGLGVNPRTGLCTNGSDAGAPRSSADIPGLGPQYRATMDDRRHIYGKNDLPERPSKTLLQLMWMAFKDKVIVSIN